MDKRRWFHYWGSFHRSSPPSCRGASTRTWAGKVSDGENIWRSFGKGKYFDHRTWWLLNCTKRRDNWWSFWKKELNHAESYSLCCNEAFAQELRKVTSTVTISRRKWDDTRWVSKAESKASVMNRYKPLTPPLRQPCLCHLQALSLWLTSPVFPSVFLKLPLV